MCFSYCQKFCLSFCPCGRFSFTVSWASSSGCGMSVKVDTNTNTWACMGLHSFYTTDVTHPIMLILGWTPWNRGQQKHPQLNTNPHSVSVSQKHWSSLPLWTSSIHHKTCLQTITETFKTGLTDGGAINSAVFRARSKGSSSGSPVVIPENTHTYTTNDGQGGTLSSCTTIV